MYPVTQSLLDALNEPVYQEATITFVVNGTTYTVSNSQIIQGSFYLDRYCASGNRVEIGSAIAAELNFKVRRSKADYPFSGARMYVQVAVQTSGGKVAIPLGYYTPYSVEKGTHEISIKAYDDMTKFDKAYDVSQFSNHFLPVYTIAEEVCDICGVTYGSFESSAIIMAYNSLPLPANDASITYRTIIQWCAAITGSIAYINYDGRLNFRWLTPPGDGEIEPTFDSGNRYSGTGFGPYQTITGVRHATSKGVECFVGTEGYVLDITSCHLIPATYQQEIVQRIYDQRSGTYFSYMPFSQVVTPCPYLFPFDYVWVEDPTGEHIATYSMFVTNVTYKLNGRSVIAQVGSDGTSDSGGSGFTSQQTSYLEPRLADLGTRIDACASGIQALSQRETGTIVSEHTIDYQWLMKDALGNVDLRLKVTATAAIAKWGIFATLPTGFRPIDSIRVVGSRGDDIIIYAIDAYGNLQVDKAIASGEAVCTALHMHFNIHGGETSS